MAINRFYLLERRFQRDPDLHLKYRNVINEYSQLDQMVLETSEESEFINKETAKGLECCYLPHHAFIKESSTTTKLRVVFDASAKTTNGNSLNDILTTGPVLQADLFGIIINWRLFKYVFATDIEKMYRRIKINEKDSHYQRIIWRDNPKINLKSYILKTVTFGTSSAPYTAIRVMHQLAIDEGKEFPLASHAIQNHMYVDDFLTGGDSIESAKELQDQLINCLKRGGFELRKWSSNCRQLLNSIPADHLEQNGEFLIKQEETIKTLGLFWNPSSDQFHYRINFQLEKENYTKRSVLSTIARLFDPLGWLNPLIIIAKIFLKKLWSEGLNWDDSLPNPLQICWEAFLEDLRQINLIKIPRWVNNNTNSSYQLHTFCDGSMEAYSAAVYLRSQNDDGFVCNNLIMGKTKVTPKQKLTIPRIELCGAVLAVKLHNQIKAALKIPTESHFWTDSTIVLSWIRGNPDRWKTFVSNRIHTILKFSNLSQWHHVRTENNPADVSSRGLCTEKLNKCNIWWHGPNWLIKNESEWPKSFPFTDSSNEKAIETEIKKSSAILAATIIEDKDCITLRYSSFIRLCKVNAWCLRFIHNAHTNLENRKLNSYLSTEEWKNSIMCLNKLVQSREFYSEISLLQQEKPISTKSKLLGLNPFVDSNQILRVGGRLKNALLSFSEKHPIILPANHHYTKLIINHSHEVCLHGGVQLTLNQIRKRYWIVQGRRQINYQLRACIRCFKNHPVPMAQLMGNLPHVRVRPSRLFTATGVDYAGPLNFRLSKGRGNKSYKGYIAVFVCLSTKAFHLEAVSDLTTSAFIAALQRFFARRGVAHDMYSDCGTTFIGANNQIQKNEMEIKRLYEKEIIPYLTQQEVKWHFIPPFSPHFGGLWEAGVKSMKYHLKRIIPNDTLTFEELSTTLCRIESCLNSRPLCPLSNNYDDITALTPGHFLIGNSLLSPPEQPEQSLSLTNRWHQLQKINHDFWNNWSKEYLSRLQSRPKWNKENKDIKIEDLVLIKEDNLPPNQWCLGRIVELHYGTDNLARVATVRTKKGIMTRPIVKLCQLPSPQNYVPETLTN